MNPEDRRKLDETYELVKENNKLLHHMRNSARWSMVFNILYWVIILGSLAAGFYYAQPYIDLADKAYTQLQDQLKTIKGTTDKIPNLDGLLKSINTR